MIMLDAAHGNACDSRRDSIYWCEGFAYCIVFFALWLQLYYEERR